MWTQKGWSQAGLSTRGGELVKQAGVSNYVQDNVKCWGRPARGVRAKVAVESESGMARQGPLLLNESGEKTTSSLAPMVAKKRRSNVRCLEFAGRLENVDCLSPTKVGKGRVVVIAGPTAVGKSRVAIALAKQLGGEIISADSIQVYEGMNVGSAKTPLDERESVPHHLLDIVAPTEGTEYSAHRFSKDARAATELVLARSRVPIVVGGTCTYLSRYMNGCKPGAAPCKAGASPELVSAAIEAEIQRLASCCPGGWESAVQMLVQAGDPATAYSLTRHDWYHLRRALEVILESGQPGGALCPKPYNYTMDVHMDGPSEYGWDYDYDFQCYFLYQHRAELYHWIDLRCEQMVADPGGLLQEASWLLDLGLMPDTSSASRGIGYQEAMEFLVECRKAGGMCTDERFLAFLSAFQQVSRSLVKKQLTWFRSAHQHSDVKQFHWIDASQPTDQILEALRTEYWRQPGYPSELSGSDARKEASYREGKILKYYKVKNRIFNNSAAIATVLKWLKQTQGGRRFSRSVVRF